MENESHLSTEEVRGAEAHGPGCDALNRFAWTVGTMAGRLHRQTTRDMVAEARDLLLLSPGGSVAGAAFFGFLLGATLRNRRSRG
jgi:hypothetical protein